MKNLGIGHLLVVLLIIGQTSQEEDVVQPRDFGGGRDGGHGGGHGGGGYKGHGGGGHGDGGHGGGGGGYKGHGGGGHGGGGGGYKPHKPSCHPQTITKYNTIYKDRKAEVFNKVEVRNPQPHIKKVKETRYTTIRYPVFITQVLKPLLTQVETKVKPQFFTKTLSKYSTVKFTVTGIGQVTVTTVKYEKEYVTRCYNKGYHRRSDLDISPHEALSEIKPTSVLPSAIATRTLNRAPLYSSEPEPIKKPPRIYPPVSKNVNPLYDMNPYTNRRRRIKQKNTHLPITLSQSLLQKRHRPLINPPRYVRA